MKIQVDLIAHILLLAKDIQVKLILFVFFIHAIMTILYCFCFNQKAIIEGMGWRLSPFLWYQILKLSKYILREIPISLEEKIYF